MGAIIERRPGRGESKANQPRANRIIQAASVVAWCCVLLGLAGAITLWNLRTQARRRRPANGHAEISSMQAAMSTMRGDGKSLKGGFGFMLSGSNRAPTRLPRYIANLATEVDDYVVSVRQVLGSVSGQNLYNNYRPQFKRPRLDRPTLSIQIMAPEERSIARIRAFPLNVTAEDEKGRRLSTVDSMERITFPKGMARLVTFSDIDPTARYLKFVEGEFVTARPGAGADQTVRHRFRIENVPLPVKNHVFGVSALTLVDQQRLPVSATRSPEEVHLLNGKAAAGIRRLFPPFAPETNRLGLPNRLLLQEGVLSRFFLDTVSASDRRSRFPALFCALKVQPKEAGEIEVEWSLGRAGKPEETVRAVQRLWDDEPAVFVLPARRVLKQQPAGRWIAVLLHLYQEMPIQRPYFGPALTPFPTDGKVGGALVGRVKAGGEPLRNGRVQLMIERLDPDFQSSEGVTRSHIPLDKEGTWRFGNMMPGRYRLTLEEAQPYYSAFTKPVPWEEYLRRRYGISEPVWSPSTQEIVVTPGGFSDLKTWNAGQGQTRAGSLPPSDKKTQG